MLTFGRCTSFLLRRCGRGCKTNFLCICCVWLDLAICVFIPRTLRYSSWSLPDAQGILVILYLTSMKRRLFLRRDTCQHHGLDIQHVGQTLPLQPDTLFARTSLHLLNKIGRVGWLSYIVWRITAHHVPRGAAFLLCFGPTDQETGNARSGRLGPNSVPGAVPLLLGAFCPGTFLAIFSRTLPCCSSSRRAANHRLFNFVLYDPRGLPWVPTQMNPNGEITGAEPCGVRHY